jgi:hypothetical protein
MSSVLRWPAVLCIEVGSKWKLRHSKTRKRKGGGVPEGFSHHEGCCNSGGDQNIGAVAAALVSKVGQEAIED